MIGMEIYTIGHSNRSMEEFMSILKKFGIEAIIDVRRFPTSKYSIFKKENIAKILEENGIHYVHLEALGGYRGGYENWMKGNEWRKAYEMLKRIAREKKACIMCAEKLPFRCHRRYIAKKLAKENWTVIHILNDKVWQEKV